MNSAFLWLREILSDYHRIQFGGTPVSKVLIKQEIPRKPEFHPPEPFYVVDDKEMLKMSKSKTVKANTLYDYYRYHADRRREGLLPVPEYRNPTLFWADRFYIFDRHGAKIEEIWGPDMTVEQFEKYKNYLEFGESRTTDDYVHHSCYKEPSEKPVMHISINRYSTMARAKSDLLKLSDSIRAIFGDKYDVIFTSDFISISCDHIVHIDINQNTNVPELIEQLNQYAKEVETNDQS